jgi:hypothetical protein
MEHASLAPAGNESLKLQAIRGELVRPAIVFAAALLIYLLLAAFIGRFPVTDEVFFKSAGRNWASGAGFGAPELEGALGDVSPPVTKVFFLHPPLYPFAFGIWTRLVGFGPRQCILFDAWIHVFLAALTFVVGWRALASTGRARRWLAMAAAIAVLPIGTAGRPDELAMLFGAIALFLMLAPRIRTIHCVLAGVALGFSLGTSSGAAIANGLVVLTILARRDDGAAQAIRRALLVGAGAISGVAIAVGPLLAAHPGALNQYLTHANFLLNHVVAGSRPWESGPQSTKYYAFLLGTFLAGLLAAILMRTRTAVRVWAVYGVGAVLYLLFLAIFLALRFRYTWFVGPWLLLAALHLTYLLATSPGRGRRAVLPAAILAAGYVSFGVHYLKETIVIATLPAAQRMDAASSRLKAVIPEGATVLTKDLWWFIAERNRTYEPMFSHPRGTIDFVALTGNGSGVPGMPTSLDASTWDASFTNRMVELDNDLPRQPTRLFGRRITNSAYGFGAIVYRLTPQRP